MNSLGYDATAWAQYDPDFLPGERLEAQIKKQDESNKIAQQNASNRGCRVPITRETAVDLAARIEALGEEAMDFAEKLLDRLEAEKKAREGEAYRGPYQSTH